MGPEKQNARELDLELVVRVRMAGGRTVLTERIRRAAEAEGRRGMSGRRHCGPLVLLVTVHGHLLGLSAGEVPERLVVLDHRNGTGRNLHRLRVRLVVVGQKEEGVVSIVSVLVELEVVVGVLGELRRGLREALELALAAVEAAQMESTMVAVEEVRAERFLEREERELVTQAVEEQGQMAFETTVGVWAASSQLVEVVLASGL